MTIFYCFSLRREYPPLSLGDLQLYIDTNRLDPTKPIDLVSVLNTGLYDLNINWKHSGIHLTDQVMCCNFCMIYVMIDCNNVWMSTWGFVNIKTLFEGCTYFQSKSKYRGTMGQWACNRSSREKWWCDYNCLLWHALPPCHEEYREVFQQR